MEKKYFETIERIKDVKEIFEKKFSSKLDLVWAPCPLFLKVGTGLQDDLAGTQTPVSFSLSSQKGSFEIVHSLAKWKRFTLGEKGFPVGKGLFTDMKAIRKEEELSSIHSHYVDQWDWERVISKEERSLDFLKKIVEDIYSSFLETQEELSQKYELRKRLPEEIIFVETLELEKEFPELTTKEREHKIAERHGAVFIVGIGKKLESGEPHDLRAADYDDWDLNGDILVWDDIKKESLELSSMGIRVDKDALIKQLSESSLEHLKEMPFQKGIIEKKLPLSVGGGIGQSRVLMFLLGKKHIGEIQVSEWSDSIKQEFSEEGISLL